MAEDISKIILDILLEHNTHSNLSKKQITKIGKSDVPVQGLFIYRKSKDAGIYVATDLPLHERQETLVHELVHAYNLKLGITVSEDDVDKTAYDWLRRIDGVYK